MNERSYRPYNNTYCSLTGIGENLAKITWNEQPNAVQKRAIMTFAAKQWYREHLNFDKETSTWNGNVLFEGQINHFVQVNKLIVSLTQKIIRRLWAYKNGSHPTLA